MKKVGELQQKSKKMGALLLSEDGDRGDDYECFMESEKEGEEDDHEQREEQPEEQIEKN